ncbi:STAS domain-containing protein [Spirillospora sp. CA-294931]|uniref:STAS domain-containing protein n=1 Tax=Spirillospora sp. CA-294931 TaxID=3240042 RepID=UPI003D8CFB32
MDLDQSDLQFITDRVGDHHVVWVTGDIDISTASALGAYLSAALTQDGKDLVVDLSGVTFMDASGLAALLRADHHATRTGGRLKLAAPAPVITRLLTITGLTNHFAI